MQVYIAPLTIDLTVWIESVYSFGEKNVLFDRKSLNAKNVQIESRLIRAVYFLSK